MKPTFVCFHCRRTARGRWVACGACGLGMIYIGEASCVPMRRSDWGWQYLERRVTRRYWLAQLLRRPVETPT